MRGDIAYTAFRYELSADTDTGHIEIEGRGTAILEKMEGRWRIVHTHLRSTEAVTAVWQLSGDIYLGVNQR